MNDLLRVYFDSEEIGLDGYPYAWHRVPEPGVVLLNDPSGTRLGLKDIIRMQAGYRCVRCGHPYPPEIAKTHPRGEWTPCDEHCTHVGPLRTRETAVAEDQPWRVYGVPGDAPAVEAGQWLYDDGPGGQRIKRWDVEAQWRILTCHHLNGVKYDCRWFNLVALCQICHLSVQGRVQMTQVYSHPHSEWFQPYAAAYYAWVYLGLELTRDETMARLDELLALELDPSYH